MKNSLFGRPIIQCHIVQGTDQHSRTVNVLHACVQKRRHSQSKTKQTRADKNYTMPEKSLDVWIIIMEILENIKLVSHLIFWGVPTAQSIEKY